MIKLKIYEDRKGEWRWRLMTGNNRIVADSGEGYTRRRDAVRAVKRWLAEIVAAAARPTAG